MNEIDYRIPSCWYSQALFQVVLNTIAVSRRSIFQFLFLSYWLDLVFCPFLISLYTLPFCHLLLVVYYSTNAIWKGTEYMLQEHKSIRTPDNGVNHLFHYLCHDRSDIQVCWLCWKKENIIIIGMSGFLENWNVWTIGVQMVSHPYICSNLKNEQK